MKKIIEGKDLIAMEFYTLQKNNMVAVNNINSRVSLGWVHQIKRQLLGNPIDRAERGLISSKYY